MNDSAYFVASTSGEGPGVLLLHSWWGLTTATRRLADRIADLGYTVLAPDLSFGHIFEDREEAEEHLRTADADRLASLTLASVMLLKEKTGDRPIGVVGMSMGGSLGLWVSVRLPDAISAVASFYAVQMVDFAGATASYQLHMAEHDELVDADEAAFMEATMGMEELAVDVHHYPGARHWFFERDRPEHDEDAEAVAWERLTEFLAANLGA